MNNISFGNRKKTLKSRMITAKELNGCTASVGSCPIYLIENLRYYSVSEGKYSINNNNGVYQEFDGYWQLSSHVNSIEYARKIYYRGSTVSQLVSSTSYGVRSVIAVPKSYLE